MKAIVSILDHQNDGTNLNFNVSIENLVTPGTITGVVSIPLTDTISQAQTAFKSQVAIICSSANLTLTVADVLVFGAPV